MVPKYVITREVEDIDWPSDVDELERLKRDIGTEVMALDDQVTRDTLRFEIQRSAQNRSTVVLCWSTVGMLEET